ncbi:MAG: hypothetical protein KJO35_04035 [Gammaproteobacteria bacterium]|nr:hypothetical protein [Gammaproteobacteria bacterium]
MNAMPWQLSYAASAELDNSELQTDVMRFMAILAFCLVAIFAIVQSIPLDAKPQTANQEAVVTVVVPADRIPARTLAEKTVASDPQSPVLPPARKVVVTPEKSALVAASKNTPARRTPVVTESEVQRSGAKLSQSAVAVKKPVPVVPRMPAAAAPPRSEPPAAATRPDASSQSADRGLSLRFESDVVLRGLVERRQVELFAIDGATFFQMQVAGDSLGFATGNKPARYHEMFFETVPAEVALAFERQMNVSARSIKWGVTLPAATSAQLQRFASTRFSGGLVIDENATLLLDGAR